MHARVVMVVLAAAALLGSSVGTYPASAAQMDGSQAGGGSKASQGDKERPPQTPLASPVFGRAASEWWRNTEVQKRLELRPRQIADIEHSWKQHINASRPVAESLTKKWQAIDQLITDQKVTSDELRHMLMVVESLRADVNTSRVVTLYKIFLILDPVQRVGLREWLAHQPADSSRGRRAN